MIKTTGNTIIARQLANVVRLVLKKACLNEEIPISGRILVKDQEGTFYSDSPKGEFLVSIGAEISLSRSGIANALGILVPKYEWRVEPRGKDTFFVTSVPTDWGYKEFLMLLSTDELVREITWRVGS